MKLPGREIQFGDRTLVMGILNITPDSFSDGAKYMDPDRAVARALELETQGADILDIGAESTRPGAQKVEAAEELRRLIPVLKKLKNKLSIPISVDTYKSEVAAKALENGAELVNDPSGLTLDLAMPKVVGDANAGLILNHMRGTPETWAKLGTLAHPMKAVLEDLTAAVNRARNGGVERGRIIIDPGLGFGKRGEQNYELLARLGEMAVLDCAVMVGPSRKSFLAQQERLDADRATGAAVAIAVMNGAHIVRVHDIPSIRPVLQTADGIARSISEETVEAKPKKIAGKAPPPIYEATKPLRPPRAVTVEPPPDERPPARDAGDRPPRRPYRDEGDRPPRRDFWDSGDRPPRPPFRDGGGDRPSRPPYRGGGDRPSRPPYRGSGDRPSRPPFRDGGGERPPRREAGGDRPPRRESGGDRPPRREGGGPPRRDGGGKSFGGPPRGGKPFGRPKGGGFKPPFRGKRRDD